MRYSRRPNTYFQDEVVENTSKLQKSISIQNRLKDNPFLPCRSVNSLVVKWNLAKVSPRVRFPIDASPPHPTPHPTPHPHPTQQHRSYSVVVITSDFES